MLGLAGVTAIACKGDVELTVIEPVIPLWILQKYVNAPAFVNVWSNEKAGDCRPESHDSDWPGSEVVLCTPSSQTQWTVSPALIVTDFGLKSKFSTWTVTVDSSARSSRVSGPRRAPGANRRDPRR